jgi:acyl-CoA dehydrogenase
MLADSVGRLFGDAAQRRSESLDSGLWQQVEALGLPLLLVGEDHGGVGGGWEDALAVLQPAGQHAIALPVAEHMLAARLLAGAGLESGGGILVAAAGEGRLTGPGGSRRYSGSLHGVPWGRHAGAVVITVSVEGASQVVLLPRAAAVVREAANLAGEPRDELRFDGCAALAAPCEAPEAAQLSDYLALLRLAQTVGALEAALLLTIDYARERKQFGRAIGQFQAVQQQLALAGAETAAVACAVRAAFRAAAAGEAGFQITAARLRANLAIGLVTATAHQVHAAIGFTREHSLRHYTQRLLSWRSEGGNDRYWSERLGAAVAARGAELFWSDLTARDDTAALAP